MKKTLLLAALCLGAPAAFAQALYEENFAYADSTQIGGTGTVPTAANPTTGWATHSGVVNQIKTGATFNQSLATTPVYPSQSGAGIQLLASRTEDISHQFTQQTSGSVYLSALVTPTAVPNGTNGSYFLHLAANTVSGATFRGRVFMAAGTLPGTVKFGVSVAANTPVYAVTEYALGTTLLLVMRYDIVTGATNDGARLYIFQSGDNIAAEPLAPSALAIDTATDPANIGAVALRQGTTTVGTAQNAGSMSIDGVRVGLAWNDAPLPVELNAFTAATSGTSARLSWTTASETNNVGFYVEQLRGDVWNTVSGLVAGRGTTTERSDYAYTVDGLTAGRHTFRLRQVDTDGTVHYSPTTSVEVGLEGDVRVTLLGQRAVRVESAEARSVQVSVYDMLGRAVLTEAVDVAGTAVVELPALAPGAYMVRVSSNGFAATKNLVVR